MGLTAFDTCLQTRFAFTKRRCYLLLQVRNPYVDPLNVIQAEVLRRLRTEQYDDEEEARLLRDALVITITGIANGQKNSG